MMKLQFDTLSLALAAPVSFSQFNRSSTTLMEN